MPTKTFSQEITSSTNSSNRPPKSLQEAHGSPTIQNLNGNLSKCDRNILKVCKALLEMDRKVNAVLKSCCREALAVYHRTSIASLDGGKQVIRGDICNITTTESFTLPASSFDGKDSLEILLSTTASFMLSAAVTSPMVSAAATSFTLAATVNSHNEDPSEGKFKYGVAKIGSIKLETKQL